MRYDAVAAALALAGSFLVAVPVAAENSDGFGRGSAVLKDTSPQQPTTGEGAGPDAGGEGSPSTTEEDDADGAAQPTDNGAADDLQPEGPIGPVGSTGVPTYEAVWAPGQTVPTAVEILSDDSNVKLFTRDTEDRSLFAALLVIDNQDAPTEYRFEDAVPDGRTAELRPDGSVQFFDSDGNKSGGIAAPWALDANGKEVPTRYTLDGTTLVQTIDHEGAAYPVAADPAWFLVIVFAARLAAPTAAAVLTACGQAQCVAVTRTTSTAVYNYVKPRGGSDGNRPTNRCNARNRSGC